MIWIDEENCPKDQDELRLLAHSTFALSTHMDMLKHAVDKMEENFDINPIYMAENKYIQKSFFESYPTMRTQMHIICTLLYDCLDYIDLLQNNETPSSKLLETTIACREKIQQMHRQAE